MLEIREVKDKEEWERFLATRPEASFLQSWYWGELYQELGGRIQRNGFYKDGELVGVMLSIVEEAKRARYLTVPGGPIIDWGDKEAIQAFRDGLERIARANRCAFVRIRPQLEASEFSEKIFKNCGFKEAPIHLHAESVSLLDLTRSEDELSTGMRKTTRYEVKKAQSLGINVKVVSNPEAVKKFYEIQLATAKRQGFTPFPYEILYEEFKIFTEAGKALLYSAEFENKLLAQAIIIFYGQEAVYHYGASTEEGRKYPGAYLIQWEAIKEAKRRGLKRYDFWGVSDPNNKTHRFYGISIFKRGFGGDDFEYLHAQDLIINYPRYVFNYVIENIRKKMRHV